MKTRRDLKDNPTAFLYRWRNWCSESLSNLSLGSRSDCLLGPHSWLPGPASRNQAKLPQLPGLPWGSRSSSLTALGRSWLHLQCAQTFWLLAWPLPPTPSFGFPTLQGCIQVAFLPSGNFSWSADRLRGCQPEAVPLQGARWKQAGVIVQSQPGAGLGAPLPLGKRPTRGLLV